MGRSPRTGMPVWFGAPDRPPVRIAGQVFGGRGAMTVRLARDLPAPALWPGRELTTDADGRFDFGPMRAGPYLLIAYRGGLTSRLTSLDTARDADERADLFVYPCEHVREHVVQSRSRADKRAPVPGAPIELAGRLIGVTDATGAYDVCISPDDQARLDVKGFLSVSPRPTLGLVRLEVRLPSSAAVGTVLRAPGVPAQRVGVQPMWWHTPAVACYPSSCRGVSAVVTTDDEGRFAYDDADLLCGFRILDRTRTIEREFEWPYGSRPGEPVVIPLADAAAVRRPLPWTRGHARVHGAPVADALVGVQDCWRPGDTCMLTAARTRRDGGFWLQVPRRNPSQKRRWVILEAAADGAVHSPMTAFVSSRSEDSIVIEGALPALAPPGRADVSDVADDE